MNEVLKTDYYSLVDARHGRFLANPNDIYIGGSMIAYGEFSEQEWHLFDRVIRPGMCVIEAGANMGAHTVPIARKIGRDGIVYAFEPQIAIFQQLCANLALNDLVNVQAFNAGCGSISDWMGIVRPDPAKRSNFGGFRLENLRGGTQTRVRVERLDDALDPPKLHLIKADVEGMEVDVLKGGAGLISKFRPLLYLEANKDDAPALISYLRDIDYKAWWHLPPMFNPDNFAGNSENLFGSIVSKNIFCAPAEKKIEIVGARPVEGPEDHPNLWSQRSEASSD